MNSVAGDQVVKEAMLKLRATDGDDTMVVSAILQDAIVPVCDMVFSSDDKNFILVAQRLRSAPDESCKAERICCALNIRGVENVQTQHIDLTESARMLDLLAVIADADSATLVFAGDAKIRLKLSNWTMFVEDFGEAWPSLCSPCHDGEVQSA